MKFNLKMPGLLLCLLLIGSLTACTRPAKQTTQRNVTTISTENQKSTETPENTTSNDPQRQTATYQIGICQINSDPYADTLTKGFQDGLNARKQDAEINFLVKKVSGDADTFADQCKEYDQTGLNLVFIENTDHSLTLDTTGYQTPTLTLPELNITRPVEDILLQLLPDIQQLGILYDSSDPAMIEKVKQMTQYLDEDKIQYQEYPATDATSFSDKANDVCDQCDAVYIPANTLALSQVSLLENIFLPAGIPLVSDHVELGHIGIAAVALNSYDLGYQYGEIAAKFLLQKTSLNPPSLDSSHVIQTYYNPTICTDFDIDVPKGILALSDTD